MSLVTVYDLEAYRKLLNKKLVSFSKNCPLRLVLSFLSESFFVHLYDKEGKSFEFPIDITQDLGKVVGNVKATLFPHYPRLLKKDENGEEIFIVEQVVLKKEEFVLRSTKTGDKYFYQFSHYPLFFLNKIRKTDNSEEMGEEFFKYAVLLKSEVG